MNRPKEKMESSYKNDPAYRITSVVVPAFIGLLILLFIWYSRNQQLINEPRTMTIYCFSAMETVMERGLLPAFQQEWLKEKQERVEFITTFAGSGVITRQIMTRFPAEVAILSSELDARRLMTAGIITASSWQELQQKQKFCQSPLVLFLGEKVTEKPRDLADIDYYGKNIIIPDPLTSGEGQIAALALYRAKLDQGFGHEDALAYVKHIFQGTANHPSTAQDAWEQFRAGLGDIMLNYESVAGNHHNDTDIRRVYPKPNIMTEHVAVALRQNISLEQEEMVASFLTFLWSDKAQVILKEHGFRIQGQEDASSLPSPLYTLDSLGDATHLILDVLDPLLAGK